MSQDMSDQFLAMEAEELEKSLKGKLAGPNGKMWLAALGRFLRGENPWVVEFPTWKIVTLGRHRTSRSYVSAVEAVVRTMGDWMPALIEKAPPSQGQVRLGLVALTPADLGLPPRVTRKQIYDAALARGLALCPAEVGPALREQYTEQPEDEELLVAMEPIKNSVGTPVVFNLGRHGDALCFRALSGSPGIQWAPRFRWVFVCSRLSGHILDFDTLPYIPNGWSIHPEDQLASRLTGGWELDTSKIELHLDSGQQGNGLIKGGDLKGALEGKKVLPAHILDCLIRCPDMIPDSWRWKAIFFWGTVYRTHEGDPCVRYLRWSGRMWTWHYYWLDCQWDVRGPAAICMS